MKRVLKIVGMILGILLLIILSFVSYIQFADIPKGEVQQIDLKVDVTPERVANGQRIAAMLCVQCHSNNEGKLVGKLLEDLPKEFGEIYSMNITQDKEKGIGNWTDGELYYFLRTGVRKDGRFSPPYMPKFLNMADEDLKDIIAWLRSDAVTVQPLAEEAPASKPSFLTKMLCRVAFPPAAFPYPKAEIRRPDTTSKLKLGEYVVNGLAGCFACHSKDFKTNNDLDPTKSVGYCGGGNPMLNMKGEVVVSSNITFDETGIAAYSEDDFLQAVKYGRKKSGEMVRYPMFPFTGLTDEEVKAAYAFLQSIPKINNKVN